MIVVTGATGTVGSKIVTGLRERGESVRALVRSGSSAPAEWDTEVEVVAADFAAAASLDAALSGADTVYLLVAVHPEMAQHELNVIDAAVRSGRSPRIVLHAAAGVEQRPAGVRFLDAHVQGYDHLVASGLPWTVLAPNGFHDNFLGAAASLRAGKLIAPGGTAPVSWVDTLDVAAAAVTVLTTPGHESAVYTLTGPESLTHTDLATILTTAVGHEVSYVDVTPEDALAGMLAAGWAPWRAEGMVELYGIYSAGYAAAVSPDVEKLTGRPGRTFAEFVAANAAVFQA